ncbi:MAG: helix-turn-helix domain-containing protein [Planctomycetota bacterium]|jgi:DNA-binding XRE family transcriptional regulator|nr:helix-turn-helix domain-containing protein [Planctomycetota bacterium]
MSAVVTHIEIALSGAATDLAELLTFLRQKFQVEILTREAPKNRGAKTTPALADDELINLRDTAFWQATTPGKLLAGYRLKHNLTQKQLSAKCGIGQTILSAYETGKRPLTPKAAIKIGRALNEDFTKFQPT